MAMFAEGLGRMDAAGLWADEALELAKEIPSAQSLYALSYFSIARALVQKNYTRAAHLAQIMGDASTPATSALELSGLSDPPKQKEVQNLLAHPAFAPMAMLLSMVPVAFRLATLKLQGISEKEIADAIDEISNGLSGSVHHDTIVTALRMALIEDVSLAS